MNKIFRDVSIQTELSFDDIQEVPYFLKPKKTVNDCSPCPTCNTTENVPQDPSFICIEIIEEVTIVDKSNASIVLIID